MPQDILNRITIKEFGRNRITSDLANPPQYGFERKNGKTVLEPMKHGDFTRFAEGTASAPTNLAFWADRYRQPEKPAGQKLSARKTKASAAQQPAAPHVEHKTIGAD